MSIHHIPGTGTIESPVTESELGRIYEKLADDLEACEDELELPIDRPQGVHGSLRRVHESWTTGERAMRTEPALAVFDTVVEGNLSEEMGVHLAAIDGMINAFDDLIDCQTSSQDDRVDHAVVAAMSSLLAAQTLPAGAGECLVDIQYHQWIELAQIPTVERELLAEIDFATDPEVRVEYATAIYQYRARDIRAFGEIPAAIHDLEADRSARIVADLQCFRARYLLFEDLRHVKRDLAEGHQNPAIALVRTADSLSEAAAHIEQIYDAFTYSSIAQDSYATVLQSLERRPVDLSGELADISETLTRSR